MGYFCTDVLIDWFRPVNAGRDTPPEFGATMPMPPESAKTFVQRHRESALW